MDETVQVAYLVVLAQAFDGSDQPDCSSGKVILQFVNYGNDGIPGVANRKDYLVCRIINPAVAGEILVSFRIYSPDGFKNADWRSKGVVSRGSRLTLQK